MAYSFKKQISVQPYGRTRRRKKNRLQALAPLMATGLGFVAFALLVPTNSSPKSEARIFTQGLSIEIDRSSPAYAALEDSLMEDTQGSDDPFNGTLNDRQQPKRVLAQASFVSTLISGTTSAASNVAEKVSRETKREEALIAQEQASKEHAALALRQAFISAPTAPRFEVQVPKQSAPTEIKTVAALVSQPAVYNHPVRTLKLADLGVRDRNELAQKFMGPLATAINGATFDPNRVRIAQHSGRRPAATLAANDVTRDHILLAQKSAVGLVASSKDDDQLSENPNENLRQVVVSGNLEFTGGVAITSANDRVVVYRDEEGEKLETGAVWLRDARYEIFVDQPVGRLVAELRTVSGDLLGRGAFELNQLPKLEAGQYRASQVALKISPVPHGIAGRVMAGTVAGSKSYPIANAMVSFDQLPYQVTASKDGKFEEPHLMEGSSIVTRSYRSGHWGTLAFAHAGKPANVSVFADQAMRALISAAAPTDMNSDRSSGFIWGRVTRGGASVAGAKVDLMTSEREIKPVYFNKLGMPDPTLKATTENGLYVFFPVEPGAHAIQAADAHGLTEPNLFPAEEHTVTQMDLELKVTQAAKVRVFDAFKTDFPLSAEVVSAGRQRGVMVPRTGETKVTFTGGNGLLMLDADAGQSYEKVRMSLDRDSKTIDFPMVQSQWLNALRGSVRLNAQPGTGTIVGFIRGTPYFRAALDDRSLAAGTQIVYFDAKGNVTRNTYGENGGGFALLNVPLGFRTVLIQPSGTSKALAAAVLVDTKVTNVVNRALQ